MKSTVEDYSERYPSFNRDCATQVDRCIGEVIVKYNGTGPAALARFFEAVHQKLAPLARDLERQNTKLQEQLATWSKHPVGSAKVKAVQEPGHANVWTIQDATGAAVARITVSGDAEAWAKRIEAGLNAQCPAAAVDDSCNGNQHI